MISGATRDPISEQDANAVAEFIRTRGVTRCPTACVLPTQASIAAADREALGEHAVRRAERRHTRIVARAQQFWNLEMVPAEN
jgi:hypothetical protein